MAIQAAEEDEAGGSENGYISISKMASLHDISRQTLLHYDHIGLFKPDHINESGYRFYTAYQIPFLREICLMKGLGFSLEEIKEHLETRSTSAACEMMTNKLSAMDSEIEELGRRRRYLAQRLELYARVSSKIKNINLPYIDYLPQRSFLFVPYPAEDMEKSRLHLTLMKAWNSALHHGILPANGFGSLLRYSSIQAGTPLKGAGSIINLPPGEGPPEGLEGGYTVPAGEYAIMYKYGMPYDTSALSSLLVWIQEHRFTVSGDDIVDQCLLDTAYYDSAHKVDFCMLQVPIR